MHPNDPIESHARLLPNQKSALKRLGLHTIRDLLYHFPVRYEPLGGGTRTDALIPGQKVSLYGSLKNLKAKKLWKSRRPATEGWFEDSAGRIKVMWFNQPYIASMAPQETLVKLSGTVGGSEKSPYIANPEIEVVPAGIVPEGLFSDEQKAEEAGVFPVYPESRGITSRWFFHKLKEIFESGVHKNIPDPLPNEIKEKYNLPELASALLYIHAPEKESHAKAARKRFSFEEVFTMQVARAKERALNDAQSAYPIPEAREHVKTFLKTLPYPPTSAQARAIESILSDFEKPHPMARLLEGDVGSGKTAVAAATSYATVRSRPPGRSAGTLQVAYMAPTEILATQHFQSFIEFFKDAPINIALITGSVCKKFPSKVRRDEATPISRTQLLKWVKNGEIAMVVGTHALIQKSVEFQNLAYAIVDEQHRFGTAQRRALTKKSSIVPHFLSMTATPIPRTLALTLYGDLDLSVLDEMPPGRAKITTVLIEKEERKEAYEKVREELQKGRQAYVICPRINEPDPKKERALQAKSAKAEAERLQKEDFKEYTVGLLHGGIKPKEKDEVMEQFAAHEIDVLVATSVVEVGINVPNATAMMIEGAERFGLAQLHQLRGRVMRSSHPPFCFLLPETKGEVSRARLKALEKNDSGFELAEIDLQTRGAGDLYGRRQSGLTDLGMEALQNLRLIEAARSEAYTLIAHDPHLKNHAGLAERIEHITPELHSE